MLSKLPFKHDFMSLLGYYHFEIKHALEISYAFMYLTTYSIIPAPNVFDGMHSI